MHASARILILALALAILSCGGDSSTGPSPQTLAGVWRATYAQFTSQATPTLRVEVIAQGATITLTLNTAGTYSTSMTAPGSPTETTTGTWTSSSDVLTLRETGMSGDVQFDMALNGTTLSLNGGHMMYDVNGDGTEEEAILDMRLTRQ